MMERRDLERREEISRTLTRAVIQDGYSAITLDLLRDSFHVPLEAAERIVSRLVRAGLMVDAGHGVWLRSTRPAPAQLSL